MLVLLKSQHDVAGEHARLLLGHSREGHLLTVLHALLDVHVDDGVLVLALLLALDLLLLLHEHAGAHLHMHSLQLVGTSRASLALGRLRPDAATSADNSSVDARLGSASVVEVLQARAHLSSDIVALLDFPLFVLLDCLHAAGVVQDLLVGVVEDLIRVPDLGEFLLRVLVWILVRVVLDGQLPVDLLDLHLVGVIREAEDLIKVLVQTRSLEVVDFLEGGMAPLAVRDAFASHTHALHFRLVLLRGNFALDLQFVHPRLAPENVNFAVLGRPHALSALAVPRGRIEGAILLELNIPPTIPVPLGALHPSHFLIDLFCDAFRPLGFARTTTAAAHLEHASPVVATHLEVHAAPAPAAAAAEGLAEELLDECLGARHPCQRHRGGGAPAHRAAGHEGPRGRARERTRTGGFPAPSI
mmetsp:Transcript_81111/g.233067  ORF Transcript_81111/g.233067 Transcript_81111/m.233067 type:complete len:415 (-) Transcript_81111:19-1263(-)